MAAERRHRPARLGTVRVRTTVAAVLVAGLAMAVGGLALVAVLRASLTRELATAARLRGQDVAEVVAADPDDRGPLAVDEPDELLIQVLDAGGRVVAASPNAQAWRRWPGCRPAGRPRSPSRRGAPVEGGGRFLAVAVGADTPAGRRTVLVVRSTEAVRETTAAVGELLAVELPLLLAVVAAITWAVVGRTLAPVEAIRAQVDTISAAALHRRVHAPGADEQTLALRRRPVDLDDLVFDEARRLRATTGLRVDTGAVSAGRVDGDATGLRRVLRNLGDNAARHAAGRVAFSVAERDGLVLLAVDDDGPGVHPADRERVFERFVRLDAARARDDGGSGLGLAIVAELAGAHGGTVAVASSPLGGARVQVTLPRRADPAG